MNAPARIGIEMPSSATQRSYVVVPGMRCAGCIGKVERALAETTGIAAARVNFTARQVTVDHAPAVAVPDIIAALDAAGFAAQPLDTDINADAQDADSTRLLRAMAVAGFAMMNIMLLSVSVWSGADGATRDLFHWLSALIALPTVAYAGRPFFASAGRALAARRTNMDVPISIGVLLTTGMSFFETATGGAHAYFDGAVMLLFFLLCGRWLDSVMRQRARSGVAAMLRHTPAGAMAIDGDGATRWCSAAALTSGMLIQVASGERLAADGIVHHGTTQIDAALLTGEAAPVNATIGDALHAGTLNVGQSFVMRVTATGRDTAIADIARLMGEAAQSRSRYVVIADRAARLYAPAVHTLALLSFAGWMIAGAGWHASLLIAVAVLIITCPCALGLAVPAAQIVAAGALMRRGVLIKDGSALERLATVDMALLDKTGTLTLGRPEPVAVERIADADAAVILALAQASRHPLSVALTRALHQRGIRPATVDAIAERAGTGVTAQVDGAAVTLGRSDETVAHGPLLSTRFTRSDGGFIDIMFDDALRPDAAEVIEQLRCAGIDSAIASGDVPSGVEPVAELLGVPAQWGLSPQDKLATVQHWAAQGRNVLMVGDGLNDGPALAAGHASMAPSSASDASRQAADAVFIGDALMPVALTVAAARRTQAIVRQNFALAIAYNLVAVPLAIVGMVTPLIAAAAMSLSSLLVVANALRLRNAAA